MARERWFGHAAHFICGHMCRFHLATTANGYLISTVGEMWPPRSSREIHAGVYDAPWLEKNRHLLGDDFDAAYMKRFGYEEVGLDRKYETMVFRAGKPCVAKGCNCGLPGIDGSELDFAGYNTAEDATKGHMKLLRKWATKKKRTQ